MKNPLKCVFGLLLVIFSLPVAAQMTTFRFSYDLGAFDITGGMVQNPAGEFVIAGLNNSFGPYYGDAMKIDAAGNVVWAKAYTAGFATNFSDIKNVSTGGYIMTGSSTSGGGGALLVRIDATGAVLWAYRYQLPNIAVGNASNEYGNAVIETSDGGFLVGGGVDYFWDGVSATTVDTASAMGFKVNSTGVLQWSKVWTIVTANPDEHYINDVAESADGYFFVGQSSEGSGTLSSNGDYPSNALVIKTTTAGALTYIRRWGAGNTTSQGINAAKTLSTGNILLGGFDDLNAFIVSISGVGAVTPTVFFNRRLNGSIFGSTYLLQDVMENADGNYSMIGTQLVFLSVSLNTMIGKINSGSGAWMFGRTYAPIGLSAILPEGGLCTDQGYYVSMTDQQMTGFNFNIIRTNTVGQTNDPAAGCPGTSITPGLGAESITWTTPVSSNYNLMTGSSFVPAITNMTPTRVTHCFNAPAALSATGTSTNCTCNGTCNGTASVTASGGTAPYTYLWSPSGGTASSASGLCPNNYTCTITDAALATTTQSFTITQPTAVTATQSQTNLSCNAVCNGTATVVASGGTPGYTYSWAPSGGTAATATGLCATNYTCTITDANGCPITKTFTLTQPSAITASAVATQTGCASNTGTATTTASGGTGVLTYSWAPSGGTAATANNLGAGTYTCAVTDANGCTQTATATVTTVNGPSATLQSQVNVLCFGGNTGTATVNATGGTPGYTYSWSPSGGTGSTGTGLSNGNYTCTITDAAGCTTTQSVAITQPTALTATNTTTPIGCSISVGTATATPAGGVGPYTYLWSSTGGTTATENFNVAGNYTCTVTDANGCTTTTVASIVPTTAPTGTLQSSGNTTCFGGSDGTATILASGNAPFTYLWSPSGGTAATATGLSAGTYTCNITDAYGCVASVTVVITSPSAISGSTSTTSTGCSTSVGTATVIPSGGTGTYTYNWLPSGGTAATATGLGAGTYTVTITDSNGCTGTATANVSSTGGPVTAVQSNSAVLCFGGLTGAGTISATGNGPFTYSWSPSGGNAATATGLGAGTYAVTVTDVGGCVTIQTITITEPTQLVSNPTATPTNCGNNNGTADAVASGGTGPYTYLWNNAQTTATLSNLASGSYSVTVTDANGCTTTSTIVVTANAPQVVALSSSTNLTCFGGSNGSATVSVTTGGVPPFTYSWSPTGGTAATATGLSAGTYTVSVTGSDGCVQTQTVTLTQPTAIVLTNATVPENCNDGDGIASVAGSGGTPGYTYVWSNASTNDTINNLSAGSYSVTVTDANGCTSTSTVIVTSTGTAIADAGTSVTIIAGQSTQLNGTGGGTYSWSPPSGLSCTTCQNPNASPTVTTTYTLTVTDLNGCTATDTVTVFVDIACGEVYLPSAFSPNGDFQNDVLFVRGNCIKILDFQVYNRWGEKVFFTSDPSVGWDGTWRNTACEAAVFTYVLKATLLDGTEIDKKGNITLVK